MLVRLISIMLFVWVCMATPKATAAAKDSNYVGSAQCQSCHQTEFAAWQQSDHFKAMQLPTSTTVLGDFNDTQFEFHGITSHFFKDKELFKVTTLSRHNKVETFTVRYTFGHYPLQQYLLDIGEGKLQAFNLAWDSRSKEEGGQRWFHLQPDENITTQHPFFWQRHFQNWNARCAECHSTNVQKNYDVVSNSFATRFSEPNVACESCHGPGKQHLELATNNQLIAEQSLFVNPLVASSLWQFKSGKTVAEAGGKPQHQEINMCGKCHALRTPLVTDEAPGGFFDKNRIEWASPPFYHSSGLIDQEAFVLGSFLQSKMYAAGVTCSNCHNAHTGKVKSQTNALCLQCHQSSAYDVPKHHQHQRQSAGAMCINCHMPDKVYMGVDARRDHSFSIPNLAFDTQPDELHACLSCHARNDASWREKVTQNWRHQDSDGFAQAQQKIVAASIDRAQEVSEYLQNQQNNPIRQGTLLTALANSANRQSVELSLQYLTSSNALLRRAAVESLRVLHSQERWSLLKSSLAENNPVVRFAMAQVLVEALPLLSEVERQQLTELIADYRYMLDLSAESPLMQLYIASLEWNLGKTQLAEQAYLNAIKIEPSYIPALVQTAEFYRAIGQDQKGEQYFIQALQVEPDNADSNHAYGLFKIRQKRYQQALRYLQKAAQSPDAQANYAYVYAMALAQQKQSSQAIDVLRCAIKKWPDEQALITLLNSYQQKIANSE